MRKSIQSRRQFTQKFLTATCSGLIANTLPGLLYASETFFIDAHVHIGYAQKSSEKRFGFDTLLKWMEKNNVVKAVVLDGVRLPEDINGGAMDNSAMLKKFQQYRDRLYPFCMIHPTAFDDYDKIKDHLISFKQQGVIGFGELKPGNNLYFDGPKMIKLYKACAEVGFPVLFHMDGEHCIDDPGLPRLSRILKELPECTFIAHGPGWWASISGEIETAKQFNGYPYPKGPVAPGGAVDQVLAEFPNIYADLSAGSGLNAIRRDLAFGTAFLKRHQDKLLFGTDVVGPAHKIEHFEFYEQLNISDKVKKKLLRLNAMKVMGI